MNADFNRSTQGDTVNTDFNRSTQDDTSYPPSVAYGDIFPRFKKTGDAKKN